MKTISRFFMLLTFKRRWFDIIPAAPDTTTLTNFFQDLASSSCTWEEQPTENAPEAQTLAEPLDLSQINLCCPILGAATDVRIGDHYHEAKDSTATCSVQRIANFERTFFTTLSVYHGLITTVAFFIFLKVHRYSLIDWDQDVQVMNWRPCRSWWRAGYELKVYSKRANRKTMNWT